MATERDKALKRAEQRGIDRAKKGGYSDGDARRMVKESVEKADAQKKKLGHW